MSSIQHTLATLSSRWRKPALFGASVIGALWLTGWLAVPPLLKWQLEKQASELLGRTVTVEKVDFRPWSLELTLEGLSMAQADGKSAQFSIKRLYADAELQSLLRLAPVIDAVSVEQPHAVLRQVEPGRFDIDDVIQRLDKPDDGSPTPRFAVFNITLRNGSLDFIDDTAGQTHELRQLLVTVPFLSNLASRRDVVTEPRVAFTLNGSPFDSQAASTPFAQTHHTRATVRIDDFDLTHYRAYWPKALPVQLGSGHIQSDLVLEFEQQDTPRVAVSGTLNLDGWQLQEALPGQSTASSPPALLGWKRLHLNFDKTEPLSQRLRLKQVMWEEPVLHVRRAGNGELHLTRIAQTLSRPAPQKNTSSAPAAPWQVDLAQFQLKGGQLIWQDASTRPAAALALQDLNLTTERITWPLQVPVKLEGSTRLQDTPLRWRGQASDQSAQMDITLEPLPLALARPYAAAALKPELIGQISAEAQLSWNAAQGDQPAQSRVQLTRLNLQDVALRSGKKTLAGVKNLLGENIEVDLGEQTIKVGKLQIDQPQAQLGRDAQGHWLHDAWLVETRPTAATSSPASASTGSSNAAPWRVNLQALSINEGQGRWEDASPSRPVRLTLSGLDLKTGPLQFPATQAQATPLSISLRLADATAPRNDPGRVRYQGKVQLPLTSQKAPTARTSLSTQGRLNIEHLPLHALEPYFAESLNLELLRADTSFRGQIQLGLPPEGLSLQTKGDVAIEDLHASTLSPAEELLEWKALNLRGVNVQMDAGQLRRLSVDETVLSDYYARIIVHPNGRINLQDLLRQGPAKEAAPSVNTANAAPTNAPPAPDIRFGPISLVNGRVNFSDQFIKPNYSANLSQLTGSLGSFSNTAPAAGQPPQLAELALKGRVEGTASLDITGQLNPLASPLALNIKGSASELELPPLSPYTVKYAGHGIERGKLSMDVSYRIDPNGQLSANNQIILNQLRFGERDPGSTAPNLPLKLAVALLADSDGVIDINLPVSGSLNDPQFRVGPIIFKLIFNLIGKAITSPFSLIAHALGGGGEELNHITFAAGSAALDDAARQKLGNVAKAMAARPALQLTITGESDLEAERNGYRQTRLQEMLLAEKRRQLARTGETLHGTTGFEQQERSALLKEVYRRADMPKPRNLIGMAKDLPDPDMEALLLSSIPVSADTIRELAVARGTAVKDYLASQQVAPARMFLGQVKPKRDSDAWQPSTELTLSIGQ